MLPQLDITFFPAQIFWLIVCFIIFFVFINYYFFPKLNKMLEVREGKIKKDVKLTQVQLEEAEEIIKKQESLLEQAQNNLTSVIESSNQNSKKIIEEKKLEIQKKMQKDIEDSKKTIEEQISNLTKNQNEEIVKIAISIIKKVDGKDANPEDLKKYLN